MRIYFYFLIFSLILFSQTAYANTLDLSGGYGVKTTYSANSVTGSQNGYGVDVVGSDLTDCLSGSDIWFSGLACIPNDSVSGPVTALQYGVNSDGSLFLDEGSFLATFVKDVPVVPVIPATDSAIQTYVLTLSFILLTFCLFLFVTAWVIKKIL